MGHSPSTHGPSWDGAPDLIAREDTWGQCRQGIASGTLRKLFLFTATVLLLASTAVPYLYADNPYPNSIITAIDTSSGLVTARENSTGKIFYFQVTDTAQLEHLRIHQGLWIDKGQVSSDGAKPCACKLVSSPADVISGPGNREPGGEGSDLLLLRDGKRQSGSTVTCGTNTCLMGTTVVPRQNIQWIGLSLSPELQATPPPLQNSATDELHLADGSIQSGTLSGIRANSVEMDGKSYDRKKVKWVYLALVSAKQTPPGFEDQTPPDSGDAGKTVKPPPPPPPPPGGAAPPDGGPSNTRPSRAANDTVKPCPADKPLGGRIEVDSDWNSSGCRGSRRAVLRFPLIPSGLNGAPWSAQLWGGFTAPEVHYELSTGGCSGMSPYNRSSCKAPNGRDAGNVTLGKAGPLGFIPAPDADGFLNFYPLKPEIAASTLLFHETGGGGRRGTFTPLECVGPRESSKGSWPFDFGGLTIRATNCLSFETDPDWEHHFFACVQPAECTNPVGVAAKRECILHAERHAVIPFAGESTWKSPEASADWGPHYHFFDGAKIHWEICCGCGDAAAPPEASSDPCPSTLDADSNLMTNRIKEEEAFKQFVKRGEAYEKALDEANAHYADYKTTVKACLIQDLATDAIIALLAPELVTEDTPHDVAAAIEMAERNGLLPPMGLQQIAKIVDKIVSGEDPTTAIDREGKQVWAETFDAIHKVETLFAGTRTVDGMEKTIEQCQGSFLVSAETKLSADKCVEGLKAALDQSVEMNKLQNDIRNLNTQLPDLQYKAWAACVTRARCEGTPESACDDKKPEGNWPPVP